MKTIYDILAQAQALRNETKLDSVSPERLGAIHEETLKYINEYQLLASSPAISKVYSSVAGMQGDAAPKSDLTGRALTRGQLVVIVPASTSDATAGDVYRYDGPSGSTSKWTYVAKIGGVPADAELNATSANPVQNKVVAERITEVLINVQGLEENASMEFTSVGVKTAFSLPIPKGTTLYLTFTSSKEWDRFAVWYGASWGDAGHHINNSDLIADNVQAGEVIKYIAMYDITEIKVYLITATDANMTINGRLQVSSNLEQKLNEIKEEVTQIIDNKTIDSADIMDVIGTSINLFNPNDADVMLGMYELSGQIYSSEAYNLTGYIPIKKGKTYQLMPSDAESGITRNVRFLSFYDSDKNFIGETLSVISEVVAPITATYMRITYYTMQWNVAQVTEGDAPIPYQPYRVVISEEYLPKETASLEYFFVPKDIYVASGRTIELYYSQILLNYQKYNIKAQCSIGASLERKFQIKGDDAHIGNYPLIIIVYDDNGNLLKSASSTIHIIDASVSNMAILPIGDSLTNGKQWLSEVRNLSKQAISFVGTRKTGYDSNLAIRHEGRSGADCKMYNSDDTYTYVDNGYSGVGADAETFDSSKSYAVGDYCKYGDAIYVFTSAHSGAWNAADAHNISQSNPFWDWNNNKFSINHYKSFYGINYDAIMIFLGMNGINLEPMTNENGALGIKTLVENIRQEDATTPIIVVNTIYRSGQNGIGTQGNTDGYKAQSEFKFDADRKVMLLAQAVEDMLGDMENVYICPVGFTHDSEYNFGNVKKEVNPRLTDLSEVFELYPEDSVHPQLEGYLQMADEIFSTICNL